MILNNTQIEELLDCFHNDIKLTTKEWIIRKHPKTIKFTDINVTYSPLNNNIIQKTLEGIVEAITNDEWSNYFFISDNGKLGWCTKDSQVVPGDGLQVHKKKIITFIRNLKLEQIGI
jgi:hypothetical protein